MKTYTTQDIADMLKCDVETIRRYIKSGKLKALKFGKAYRITQEQLEQFIDGGK